MPNPTPDLYDPAAVTFTGMEETVWELKHFSQPVQNNHL